MKEYTKAQQVTISYYMLKIQQAWSNREKQHALELEQKLEKLIDEFNSLNAKERV